MSRSTLGVLGRSDGAERWAVDKTSYFSTSYGTSSKRASKGLQKLCKSSLR